jgi:hypothetical protein
VWQRDFLGDTDEPDSESTRQLDYWTKALEGVPEALDVATDYLRPALSQYAGEELPFEVPTQLLRQRQERASRCSTSANTARLSPQPCSSSSGSPAPEA